MCRRQSICGSGDEGGGRGRGSVIVDCHAYAVLWPVVRQDSIVMRKSELWMIHERRSERGIPRQRNALDLLILRISCVEIEFVPQ